MNHKISYRYLAALLIITNQHVSSNAATRKHVRKHVLDITGVLTTPQDVKYYSTDPSFEMLSHLPSDTHAVKITIATSPDHCEYIFTAIQNGKKLINPESVYATLKRIYDAEETKPREAVVFSESTS